MRTELKTEIVLFEDHCLADMTPLHLARPAFAVTCACLTLADVVRDAARSAKAEVRAVVREHLLAAAARIFPGALEPMAARLFLNASIVPDAAYAAVIADLIAHGEPFMATSGQRVTAAFVPAERGLPESFTPQSVTPWILDLNLPLMDRDAFRTFDRQYQVIGCLKELFPRNLSRRLESGAFREIRRGVWAADGVEAAENAVFHTEGGPVVLDRGVKILDFTYFTGPVYVGPRSRIIERSSVKEFTCIGETCKIGGEVEECIVESFTNKQHHGFLGHAYVGSWVNLGAGTSSSDLKNTYGEIRLEFGGKRVETGMQFLGCMIGDYSKSAINTSIFTGKLIGVSSMLYGFVGQHVPSFCNYARSFGQITECPVEQAILIQKRMFSRRGIEQTADDISLLKAVFDMTRSERLISDEPPAL